MRRFNRVITAALCSTICSAMLVPAAYAQTAQAEEDSGDEPIIVTATLRAMDVQDIPLAVTAVAPEALERQGVNDIKNLASISPSINIQFADRNPRYLDQGPRRRHDRQQYGP